MDLINAPDEGKEFRYNQLRNDWIERIDDAITQHLDDSNVELEEAAPHNSETVGSVVDRLSILALRIYHMEEQMDRTDVEPEHIEKVQQKLAVCFIQLDDLSNALQHLVDDIIAGRKLHKTYRQFKMYNDPTLNPYLYKTQQRKAG